MIKKIFLLSVLVSVAACTSYNEYKGCDPEKNYIISDPVAMEEYKKINSEGKVKNYYLEILPIKDCNNSMCVNYDTNKLNFIERNYSNGIYTIKNYDKKLESDCIKEHPVLKSHQDRKCFKLVKNDKNIINSQYKYSMNTKENVTVIKFYDMKKNKLLYEYSYQIYSTVAIGGPGFGNCPIKNINHPEYKFNPYSFNLDNK